MTSPASLLPNTPNPSLISDIAIPDLERWLISAGWLAPDHEVLALEMVGAGNMNLLRRVRHTTGTFILKQSVPWVAKYPQIAAPHDRVLAEATFYRLVSQNATIASRMPLLHGLDPTQRILHLSDLGACEDWTSLYQGNQPLTPESLTGLASWLIALHRLEFSESEKSRLGNRDMRQLNFEHIFQFPFHAENGLELDHITPGLQQLATELQQETSLIRQIEQIGRNHYLKDGPTLIHGDFFPGSILGTPADFFVIDPEFAHFGCAEFDVGVFAAHLILSRQPESSLHAWFAKFAGQPGFNATLARRLAGIEILRRLLGVAQLPLQNDLAKKKVWIAIALRWILR